jgi:hypothetical protein
MTCLRRLVAIGGLIALVGCVLAVSGAGPAAFSAAAHDPVGWADQVGTDAVALTAAVAACWLILLWLGVGLLLTAVAALPGSTGRLADAVARRALPSALRRASAVLLGLSLSTSVAACSSVGIVTSRSSPDSAATTGVELARPPHPPAPTTAHPTPQRAAPRDRSASSRAKPPAPSGGTTEVDWPLGPAGGGAAGRPPGGAGARDGIGDGVDWPLGQATDAAPQGQAADSNGRGRTSVAAGAGRRQAPSAATTDPPDMPRDAPAKGRRVVVAPGDCLWLIAARRLGVGATDERIATETRRWYSANETVIGPDPDLIRPDQIIVAPP